MGNWKIAFKLSSAEKILHYFIENLKCGVGCEKEPPAIMEHVNVSVNKRTISNMFLKPTFTLCEQFLDHLICEGQKSEKIRSGRENAPPVIVPYPSIKYSFY